MGCTNWPKQAASYVLQPSTLHIVLPCKPCTVLLRVLSQGCSLRTGGWPRQAGGCACPRGVRGWKCRRACPTQARAWRLCAGGVPSASPTTCSSRYTGNVLVAEHCGKLLEAAQISSALAVLKHPYLGQTKVGGTRFATESAGCTPSAAPRPCVPTGLTAPKEPRKCLLCQNAFTQKHTCMSTTLTLRCRA